MADDIPFQDQPGRQRTRGVDSARRALQILLQFSETHPELAVESLVEEHGISLPSAYRYVSLLRELDLIEERGKGVFVLSPQVLSLARAAEHTLDYRDEAQPVLDRLVSITGETALYIRRVNESAVCVAISESDHPISISFSPGHMMPLHGGAAAKILLADYPRRLQYLYRAGVPSDTRKQLEADFDRISAENYAESSAEVDADIWAAAAGVRVKGALVGVVTVAAPVYRLNPKHRPSIAESVRQGAADLEAELFRP